MKLSRTFFIILLLVAVLLAVKFLFLGRETPPVQGPGGKAQQFPVTIQVLQPRTLDHTLSASGTLLSNEEVIIIPEVPGRVEKIFFKEGGLVKKGELLVKINDDELRAQLRKLNLQLELSRDMEARQKKLLAVNGVSQEEYDITLNKVNSLQADIELLQAQLVKTSITAPFNGRIGLKNISEGSYVNSSTNIASLQQTDPIKIDFSVPEKYASQVRLNDRVNFEVPGSGQVFTAVIYAIESRIDPVTRTLALRARCENKDGMLLPGSFARIELIMNSIRDALMVPTQSLIPELRGQKVFVSRNGKAEAIQVKTGIRTESEIQITEGLQAGDSVVVTGFMSLKPGSGLRILKEPQ